MRRAAACMCVLCYLSLFVAGAFLGFDRVALDSVAYDRLHEALNVYDYVGIDAEAMPRVTAVLAGYLRGDVDSIDIEEEVFGVRQQVFNERERAHMVDVPALFRLERTVRVACLIAAPILLAATVYLARGRLMEVSLRAFRSAVVLLAALGLAAALTYATRGFDEVFLAFHRLFFSNDLWLLNPATDAMIRMLPAEFFAAIAAQAGKSALIGGCALAASGQLMLLAVGGVLRLSGSGKG